MMDGRGIYGYFSSLTGLSSGALSSSEQSSELREETISFSSETGLFDWVPLVLVWMETQLNAGWCCGSMRPVATGWARTVACVMGSGWVLHGSREPRWSSGSGETSATSAGAPKHCWREEHGSPCITTPEHRTPRSRKPLKACQCIPTKKDSGDWSRRGISQNISRKPKLIKNPSPSHLEEKEI